MKHLNLSRHNLPENKMAYLRVTKGESGSDGNEDHPQLKLNDAAGVANWQKLQCPQKAVTTYS